MRWKQPTSGTRRNRRAFLIFPKRIGDDKRWLEVAAWEEIYRMECNLFAADSRGNSWQPRKWID